LGPALPGWLERFPELLQSRAAKLGEHRRERLGQVNRGDDVGRNAQVRRERLRVGNGTQDHVDG
jgi:hypothetical protein